MLYCSSTWGFHFMCITFGTLCLVYIDPQGSNSMILSSLGIIVYDDPVSNITSAIVVKCSALPLWYTVWQCYQLCITSNANNKESCKSVFMLRGIVECICRKLPK